MADVKQLETDLKESYKVLYENDRRAALRMLKELGEQYHQEALTYFQQYREKLEHAIGWEGKIPTLGFRIGEQVGASIMNDVRSMAGGAGGLGQAANEFGKILGEAIGAHTTSETGKKIATFSGLTLETMIRAYGMYETARMMGARLAPVITAGRGTIGQERGTDFAKAGLQALQNVAELRQQTGASQQAVLGVITDLSRVGIAFDDVGKKATRYVLAADMVLNLTPGTSQKIVETLVRDFGESWRDVKGIMTDLTADTGYWGESFKEHQDGLSQAMSANAVLADTIRAVGESMKGTNMDMVGLTKVMFSFRDVMGGIGIRPAAMTEALTEFFKGAAPKAGSFEDTATQTFFARQFLGRTEEGQNIEQRGLAYAAEHGISPMNLNVAFDQLLGSGGLTPEEWYTGILGGIAAEKATLPGDESSKNMDMQVRLEKRGIVHGTKSAYLVLSFSDALRRVREMHPGMGIEEAMRLAGKDPTVLANIPVDMRGMSEQKLLDITMGRGQASLSAEQKIKLAAERMRPLDWILKGRPTIPGMTDTDQDDLQDMARGVGFPASGDALDPKSDPVARFLGGAKNAVKGLFATPPSASTALVTVVEPPKEIGSFGAPRKHPVATWSRRSSGGVTQTVLTVDDKFINSSEIHNIMAGIASVESAGRGGYSAVGQEVTKGRYAGQHALGKYQVMPGNIPAWSKAALGREVTPDEFYGNPELQDRIVEHEVEKMYAKYGNSRDVYSWWLTGKPFSEAAANPRLRDDLGTNAAMYSSKAARGEEQARMSSDQLTQVAMGR